MSDAKKFDDLTRFIKNKTGEKVQQKTTSINIEVRHFEFLERKKLNLSKLVREFIDSLIESDPDS